MLAYLLMVHLHAAEPPARNPAEWTTRCTDVLTEAGKTFDAKHLATTARVIASAGPPTAQVAIAAGPSMGPEVLDASAVLWDHDVEQTDGWMGSADPPPMNEIRHMGRVGLTLSGGAAHSRATREAFEALMKPALEACAGLQPPT